MQAQIAFTYNLKFKTNNGLFKQVALYNSFKLKKKNKKPDSYEKWE